MSADLFDIDPEGAANAGFVLKLLHPNTNEPLDAWIKVLGQDSTVFLAMQTAQNRRAIEEATNGVLRTAEERDEQNAGDALEVLVACTVEWGLSWEGAELPLTPANARMVYKARRWIRHQAEAAIMRRANFRQG